ncbi:MAG: tRNA (adenosine(37)-N6)-threonylcarbamoyltransferase complex dimerization subunit type 1 TsaB [Chloroflexi bacterium]|nr:tRNA (adenosine(37)-N6)-threonylcarbamoyltransferase complex dimerization subunit type 1 TsaB [Chloroflexota bacterium]
MMARPFSRSMAGVVSITIPLNCRLLLKKYWGGSVLPWPTWKALPSPLAPGSYTGLRVGLALAKGLALANQIPLLGVPTLDIVAFSIDQQPEQLLIAAEAGRTRVCAAIYQWQDKQGWQARRPPVIDTWENLLTGIDKPTLFAGEMTPEAMKLIRSRSRQFAIAYPAVPRAAPVIWRKLAGSVCARGEWMTPPAWPPFICVIRRGNDSER